MLLLRTLVGLLLHSGSRATDRAPCSIDELVVSRCICSTKDVHRGSIATQPFEQTEMNCRRYGQGQITDYSLARRHTQGMKMS